MVRKVHAGECVWTEVVRAFRCQAMLVLVRKLMEVVPDQLRESFSSTRAGFCQLDADQTYPYPKLSDTNLSRWQHCALAETVAVHLAGH